MTTYGSVQVYLLGDPPNHKWTPSLVQTCLLETPPALTPPDLFKLGRLESPLGTARICSLSELPKSFQNLFNM